MNPLIGTYQPYTLAVSLPHHQSNPKSIMDPVWIVLWSALLSLTWLVKPHILPWPSFLADAWIALITLMGACAVVVRTRSSMACYPITCLAAFLVVLPWLQFTAGLLPYAGQAWISSSYLFGFLLALLVGTHWEQTVPRQLAHALFGAICVAGVASVALQLSSWLGLNESGGFGAWAAVPVGNRPSANLGQPNQLATLLVWSVLGCLWGYTQKKLGGLSASVVASFLLLGLAMTQSRAGMLAISCVLLAVWGWKRVWASHRLPWAATGLYLLFVAFLIVLPWVNKALLLSENSFLYRHHDSADRLQWKLFMHAIFERRAFGYGWTEVGAAQLTVAEQFPALGSLFAESHNFFIDFFLWCGIPTALLVVVTLLNWLWSVFRAVCHAEDVILFMLVVVVSIHALVEYPLKYAYFLLPVGLVMGILSTRLRKPILWWAPKLVMAGLVMAGSLALAVTVRDYARIEDSYRNFRLDKSILGQGREPMGHPPDVLALTHMREWIRWDNYTPHKGMDKRELNELETATYAFPSPYLAYRLAKALALNSEPEKASLWLIRICKFAPEVECLLLKKSWEAEGRKNVSMASIVWPQH